MGQSSEEAANTPPASTSSSSNSDNTNPASIHAGSTGKGITIGNMEQPSPGYQTMDATNGTAAQGAPLMPTGVLHGSKDNVSGNVGIAFLSMFLVSIIFIFFVSVVFIKKKREREERLRREQQDGQFAVSNAQQHDSEDIQEKKDVKNHVVIILPDDSIACAELPKEGEGSDERHAGPVK